MSHPRRCRDRHQVLLLAILEESFCRCLVMTRAAAAVQQAPRSFVMPRTSLRVRVEALRLQLASALALEGSQVALAAFGRGAGSTAASGHVELASVPYPGRRSPPLPWLGIAEASRRRPGGQVEKAQAARTKVRGASRSGPWPKVPLPGNRAASSAGHLQRHGSRGGRVPDQASESMP